MVFDFNLKAFVTQYKFKMLMAYNALKILQRDAYVELTEEVNTPSKLIFTIIRDDLYKFQVSNAKFDVFLKLILRLYTGLFSDYISIDEDYIAKKAGLSVDEVVANLAKLK